MWSCSFSCVYDQTTVMMICIRYIDCHDRHTFGNSSGYPKLLQEITEEYEDHLYLRLRMADFNELVTEVMALITSIGVFR